MIIWTNVDFPPMRPSGIHMEATTGDAQVINHENMFENCTINACDISQGPMSQPVDLSLEKVSENTNNKWHVNIPPH